MDLRYADCDYDAVRREEEDKQVWLRAEVDRLTAERDKARGEVKYLTAELERAHAECRSTFAAGYDKGFKAGLTQRNLK